MNPFQRSAHYVGLVQFVVLLYVVLINQVHGDSPSLDDIGMPCTFADSINASDGSGDKEGNWVFKDYVFSKNQYATFNYEIVDKIKRPVPSHVRGCICLIKTCLRFCCPFNSYSNGSLCEPYTEGELNYEFPLVDSVTGTNSTVNIFQHFGSVVGKPCSQYIMMDPDYYDDERYELLEDGSLRFADLHRSHFGSFCFTHVYSEVSNDFELEVFDCVQNETELKFAVYPYGMLASVPFLLVTFLVYALIPELQNLHGKNLMCYVFCLFVGYILMSSIQLFTDEINQISPKFCEIIGFSVYYAFMASFFWLNVMCFDIWWTFRGVRGGMKDAEKRKFILYSAYAWSCSVAILSLTLIANYTDILPENYRPNLGINTCWLEKKWIIELVYLYAIVIILIVANIILFTCTSYKILKLQRETAAITKGDSRKFNKLEADKDRFGLYLRLFIVMGVSWCFEFLSWAMTGYKWFFFVTDFFNCLQGLFIFGLFVWKPKIKHLIIKRYRTYKGLPTATSSSRYRTSNTSNIYTRQSSRMTNLTSINNNNNYVVEKTLMSETD